jgi:hypothetical protein
MFGMFHFERGSPMMMDGMIRSAVLMLWMDPAQPRKGVRLVATRVRRSLEEALIQFREKGAVMEEDLSGKDMSEVLGPTMADHQIRQAIQMCWMLLPKERQTVGEVEKELRRLVERAIDDMKEDAQAFGME